VLILNLGTPTAGGWPGEHLLFGAEPEIWSRTATQRVIPRSAATRDLPFRPRCTAYDMDGRFLATLGMTLEAIPIGVTNIQWLTRYQAAVEWRDSLEIPHCVRDDTGRHPEERSDDGPPIPVAMHAIGVVHRSSVAHCERARR
jgi:hypothetical protein